MKQLDLDNNLIQAASYGDLDRVKKLISQGANPEREIGERASAVQTAAFEGDLDLIKYFHEELGLTKDLDCILNCADSFGYWEVLKYLEDIGYEGC